MSIISYGNTTVVNINDGDSYIIQSSDSSIVLNKDGNYSPSKITLSGKYKQGINNLDDYSGRFKIETTSDNENWITQYTSNTNEKNKIYELPISLENKEPYQFRQSGGSLDIGNREDDMLVGGSIVWNQAIDFREESPKWKRNQATLLSYIWSDGVLQVSTSSETAGAYIYQEFNQVNGHKYLCYIDAMAVDYEETGAPPRFSWYSNVQSFNITIPKIRSTLYAIVPSTTDGINRAEIRPNQIGATVYAYKMMLFDLTQMFGSEVADAVYAMEQAEAGAGVAWFRKLFPNDYYEYNSGELMSVEGVSAHETVGKNLFDSPVIANNPYSDMTFNKAKFFKGGLNYTISLSSITNATKWRFGFRLFDTNGGIITYVITNKYVQIQGLSDTYSNGTICMQSSDSTVQNIHFKLLKDAYIVFCFAWGDVSANTKVDYQVEIGNIATAYEPYVKHSYPLDNSLTLRGIPKIDVGGNLYYDGDTYESDGTVTRKYGIVDLGTLNWTAHASFANVFYTYDDFPTKTGSILFITPKYTNGGTFNRYDRFEDKHMYSSLYAGRIAVKDTAYTDANTFKAAMSGVMLVYELATPTTETAQPYQNPQIVDNWGTEEYVTTSIVPVGHETKYLQDIKNIRCSLYQAGGVTTLLDQITIPILDNIEIKTTLIKVTPEYTVFTSATSLPSNSVWTETKPSTVDSTHYLWTRTRSDFSDGSHTYSDAVCDAVISGVISEVNTNTNSITNKVWESDITTKINQYDGSTVKDVRDRVTQTETSINGITQRVTSVEGTASNLGVRMSTAESSITQNADNIALKVDKNGVISSINQSSESITIDANKVNLVGNVSFNMFNNSLQNEFNDVKNKAENIVETIIGTQTAATRFWTGTSTILSELKDGIQITYWLPFANKSETAQSKGIKASELVPTETITTSYGNDWLNLTLADGTKTGWVPCYYGGTSRLTSHYGANNAIHLTYREGVSSSIPRGWWADATYYQNSSYTQHSAVKAGSNGIRGYTLIMKDTNSTWVSLYNELYKGTATGKTRYTGGLILDKVLYSSGAGAQTSNSSLDTYYNYKSGVVTSSIYEVYPLDLRYSTNCGTTLVSQKSVYLVGTINNDDGLFYLDDVWYTQDIPTTEDGKVYIYLGTAYSTYQLWLVSKNTAYQFYNGEFMPFEDVKSLKAQQAADTANLWINGSGKTAKQIIDNWATDATSATTTIKGGLIQTHTITANQLATNAIMSNNYQASSNSNSPYSVFGTFLDLSNGNFYTPNFGVQSTGSTGAYINGEIIATAGRIGEDENTAWYIGTFTDYEANDHGSIIGHGDAFIQSGKWMISGNKINTRWYDNNNEITYIYDTKSSTYYDYGMNAPIINTADSGYIENISTNFLYIRKHATTIPSLETDWNYVFKVDNDGNIHASNLYINGTSIADMISDGVDGGAYLPTSGGTVNGNVTITGTLTATANKANQLTHWIKINNQSFDGSANITIGTLGVEYGGTGQTSFTSGAVLIGNGSNAIQTRAIRNNTSQGALGWTSASTDTTLITTNTLAYWNGAYQNTSSNIIYVKQGKLGDIVTHSVSEFITTIGGIIDGSLSVTDLTAGDLVVNGVGRFTNGLYGELTGDVSGNASTASKLDSNRDLTIGKTKKSIDWSGAVSFTQAEISDNASTSAAGWMSKDDKSKLNGIEAEAQVNTITGIKGGSETSYRTGNVNITATNIGLGNLTNNKQIKGLSSGTTSGHLVTWGADGYTVSDSGIEKESVTTKLTLSGTDYSVSSNAIVVTKANLQSAIQDTNLVLMTAAERSKLSSIQVSEGGTIDFSGVTASAPITATVATDKTVNITHNTSGVTAGTYKSVTVNTYGHVTGGTNPTTLSEYGITDAKITNGVITLGSNTITPLTSASALDATKLSGTASISTTGNASTATQFASNQSITLTGDTTGTVSSQAGWSITTKTDRLSTIGDERSVATTPNDYVKKLIFQGLKTNSSFGSPSTDTYSYVVGLKGWTDSSGGKAHEFAFNNSGINHRIGATDSWEAWEKIVTSTNYTDYTVKKDGTGASGTWNINISGTATKASQDGDGNTISSTYAKLSGATFTGAVSGTSFSASSYMTVNSGNSATTGGLALYGTTPTTYGIAMRTTVNQGKHGYVQGDWGIYSFINGADDRGWIFKNTSSGKGNVASISNLGHAVFNGSITVGGNTTNDSGCRIEYNTTTASLDFIFNQ